MLELKRVNGGAKRRFGRALRWTRSLTTPICSTRPTTISRTTRSSTRRRRRKHQRRGRRNQRNDRKRLWAYVEQNHVRVLHDGFIAVQTAAGASCHAVTRSVPSACSVTHSVSSRCRQTSRCKSPDSAASLGHLSVHTALRTLWCPKRSSASRGSRTRLVSWLAGLSYHTPPLASSPSWQACPLWARPASSSTQGTASTTAHKRSGRRYPSPTRHQSRSTHSSLHAGQ